MRQTCHSKNRIHPTHRWTALGLLLLATLIGLGRPVDAQIEMRTFYQGFTPTVSREDLNALKDTFELDKSQEELVQAVYDGYRSVYNAAADAVQDNQRRLTESMGQTDNPGQRSNLAAELSRTRDEWGLQASALEVSFFADVKNLLTEEQSALWPRFERDRRRRVGLLIAARLMPERVDLVELLDSLELPDEVRATCEPVVDQYTLDFDTPLTLRIRLSDQMETLANELGAKADAGGQLASLQQRLVGVHVQIRDVNIDYAERIASQLPAEDGKRFREAFQRRAWPRVFGSDQVGTDVARVRRLAALTPGQDEAITALVSAYESRVEPINRELVQVELMRELQRLSPPTSQGTGKPQPGAVGNSGDLEGRSHSLLASRQTLIQSTLADIRSVLTPVQLQSLTREPTSGAGEDNRQ